MKKLKKRNLISENTVEEFYEPCVNCSCGCYTECSEDFFGINKKYRCKCRV